MTQSGKDALVASVLGLGTLVAALIFAILIPFIAWANWLSLTEPAGGGSVGDGILMVPLLFLGLLAGLCVGIAGWAVLWEERASQDRWRIHRGLARWIAVGASIVLAGCAEALGVRPEIPVLYRVLLVAGIVGATCWAVFAAFRWNAERQVGG